MNAQIPVINSFEARVGLDEAVVVISVVRTLFEVFLFILRRRISRDVKVIY